MGTPAAEEVTARPPEAVADGERREPLSQDRGRRGGQSLAGAYGQALPGRARKSVIHVFPVAP